MKDTGMARKVDDLGRIVLPVELRRLHGIKTGDALEISVDGDSIVLRKLFQGCVFCGDGEGLTVFRGRSVCPSCKDGVAALVVSTASTATSAAAVAPAPTG